MEPMHVDHLILGANLYGLALADQILRRNGGSVVVVEGERAPNRRGLGGGGVVLRTHVDAYRSIEDRALVLLEEWPDYLGADPGYVAHGAETLSDAVPSCNDAGTIDALKLLAALYQRVRELGGRLLFDTKIDRLEQGEDGFAFSAGGRPGVARQLHLTGESTDLRRLHEWGETPSASLATWHDFELTGVPKEVRIVVGTIAASEPQSFGLELDFDDSEDDANESGEASSRFCWIEDGSGEARLWVEGEATHTVDAPTVDWAVLERARRELAESLPNLTSATVRRGSAELLFGLADTPPPRSGPVWISGAFGMHTPLLALGVAELIAENAIRRNADETPT